MDQCYRCGSYSNETYKDTTIVDLDPGNAEYGPAPQPTEVHVCPKCKERPVKTTTFNLTIRYRRLGKKPMERTFKSRRQFDLWLEANAGEIEILSYEEPPQQ